MERHRIGIVIPALNEQATITRVVASASLYGFVIVVDDGSIDETGALAAAEGATVVRHNVNLGYDEALNSGFARAAQMNCHYVVTLDADGQHDPARLLMFNRALEEGADIVIGIRDRCQRLAEYVFAWVGLRKWGIHDPLCGMKGYRVDLYKELGHFDSYSSIGTELAIYAAKARKKIIEIPIATSDRHDQPRFGRRFSANISILRALLIPLLRS